MFDKKEYDKKYRKENRDKETARIRKFWKENPEKRKENRRKTSKNLVLRLRDKKRKYVMLSGGCCSMCGYRKNLSALTFHHLRDKSFNLSHLNLLKEESIVLEEISKCQLVCSNCHKEIHWPQFNM